MFSYMLFLLFWLVFGVLYLSRDKALDEEKIKNCELW